MTNEDYVTDTDVVVIGGGPAGSTAASFLSKKGYSVTVLERAKFPRHHVGESMLPFCYHVFKDLGILETMEERFVRKPGVRFIDTDGTYDTAWCFNRHITDESALSFQVIRSEFDDLLLRHSEKLGATVFEETRVVDAVLGEGDEPSVVVAKTADGTEQRFRARFVVDASGRDTFMSNRLGTKTAHKELERTAISCTNWKGAKFKQTLEQGLIQIVYLGGEKQGWMWCIPLGNDRLSVGVVVNTSYYKAARTRLQAAGVEGWKKALYLEEIAQAPFTRDILEHATMHAELQVDGDYSYICHKKWDTNMALIGDASAFIDPIFSTGVYMAMSSGRIAADAIDVRLTKGIDDGAIACKEAYESIVGAYNLIDKLIRLFYTPESINFAQLSHSNEAFADFDHYRNAMSVYHFLIAGDFFERPAYYDSFVEQLREEKLYRRFKKTVLDRPTLNTASCDVPTDVAFHPGLKLHEARRAAQGI
jgi:flavin-dependent dehydrogenase